MQFITQIIYFATKKAKLLFRDQKTDNEMIVSS